MVSSMKANTAEELAAQLGADWRYLAAGRQKTAEELTRLLEACRSLVVPDTSLVVFGSLARGEFTDSSDIDWTLLVDGITIPEHAEVARQIGAALDLLQSKRPGRTGTFGNIASSHNLIHFIGGEDDTNGNTTRRSLLLLEAQAIGDSLVFNRVRNNILKRYLKEDLGLWRDSTKIKIPHFLLNDFARYWRTMAVDFADKQHDRFHDGFALRNIKLRLSRKLMYMSGLLACFRCQLDFPDEAERLAFFQRDNSVAVAAFIGSFLNKTPLDLTAETLLKFVDKPAAIEALFKAYDSFLAVLSDATQRKHLEELTPDQFELDPIYAEARAISHSFADAVQQIFLTADNPIGQLTIRYGVF
jgi:predicted nucleotidyltransferase